jgi:AP endonuclease-1
LTRMPPILTSIPNAVEEVPAPKKRRTKAAAATPMIADYPPRTPSAWKIGAHFSAAGGVENAILNAAAIGCVS